MQISLLCTSFTIPVSAIAQTYEHAEYNILNYSKDKKKLKKHVKELQTAVDKGEEAIFTALRKIVHFCEKRFHAKFSCTEIFAYLEKEGIAIPYEWQEAFKKKYRYYVKKKKAEIEFFSTCSVLNIYGDEAKDEFVVQYLAAQGIHEPEEDVPLSVVWGVTECLAGGFLMFCGSCGAAFGPWSVTLWSIGISVAMDGVSRLTGEYIDMQDEYDFNDV